MVYKQLLESKPQTNSRMQNKGLRIIWKVEKMFRGKEQMPLLVRFQISSMMNTKLCLSNILNAI